MSSCWNVTNTYTYHRTHKIYIFLYRLAPSPSHTSTETLFDIKLLFHYRDTKLKTDTSGCLSLSLQCHRCTCSQGQYKWSVQMEQFCQRVTPFTHSQCSWYPVCCEVTCHKPLSSVWRENRSTLSILIKVNTSVIKMEGRTEGRKETLFYRPCLHVHVAIIFTCIILLLCVFSHREFQYVELNLNWILFSFTL